MVKLRDRRKELGLSQAELARLADATQPQIFRLEKGERKLTKEWAEKLAPHLKVDPISLLFDNNDPPSLLDVKQLKVIGTAEAGAFRDISLVDEVPVDDLISIPIVRDTRFEHAQQYALKLAGDSMNLVYPDGCYVICAQWGDIGLGLKPGMRLHVERNTGPLVEVTIKEYIERDGRQLLTPRSTNPLHKEIEIDGDEFYVRGLVIGAFMPEAMV